MLLGAESIIPLCLFGIFLMFVPVDSNSTSHVHLDEASFGFGTLVLVCILFNVFVFVWERWSDSTFCVKLKP